MICRLVCFFPVIVRSRMLRKLHKMDIKDFLYAWCGINKFERPIYKIDEIPDNHLNRFAAHVSIEKTWKFRPKKTISTIGFGSNKKIASNETAKCLCENLVRCGLMDVSEFESCVVNKTKRIGQIPDLDDTVWEALESLGSNVAKQIKRLESSQSSSELKNSAADLKNFESDSSRYSSSSDEQMPTSIKSSDDQKKIPLVDITRPTAANAEVDTDECKVSKAVSPPKKKRRLDDRDDTPFSGRRQKRLRVDDSPPSTSEEANLQSNQISKTLLVYPQDRKKALAELDRDLWLHYENNIQTDVQCAAKFQLASEMTNYLRMNYRSDVTLFCVGSTVSGLGSRSSDLDLCLVAVPIAPGVLDPLDRDATILVLKQLRKHLFKFFGRFYICNQIEFIPARVPILRVIGVRLDYGYEIDIDINVNNFVGIRNSHLLHYYVQCDKRFAVLTLAVKHWAIKSDVCDAKNGTLSSYALALMVLHFLLSDTHPAVLPNLQVQFPNLFNKIVPVRNLKLNMPLSPSYEHGINNSSLAELCLKFFEYYSNMVDFDNQAISVSAACRFGRSRLPVSTDHFYIFIEEPFDCTNVARCVLHSENYEKIKQSFSEAYYTLSKTLQLSSIGIKCT